MKKQKQNFNKLEFIEQLGKECEYLRNDARVQAVCAMREKYRIDGIGSEERAKECEGQAVVILGKLAGIELAMDRAREMLQ